MVDENFFFPAVHRDLTFQIRKGDGLVVFLSPLKMNNFEFLLGLRFLMRIPERNNPGSGLMQKQVVDFVSYE